MTSGLILTLVLVTFLLLWLVADLVIWITGRETMSQWIIKKSKRSIVFTITTLVILTSVYIILILHWELIEILIKHL